jgi:hypothetical protein
MHLFVEAEMLTVERHCIGTPIVEVAGMHM